MTGGGAVHRGACRQGRHGCFRSVCLCNFPGLPSCHHVLGSTFAARCRPPPPSRGGSAAAAQAAPPRPANSSRPTCAGAACVWASSPCCSSAWPPRAACSGGRTPHSRQTACRPSARQTASHASRSWGSDLFDPAAHHTPTVQASAPSLWDKKPATGALVPVTHPFERNTPGVVVPRSRMDPYVAPTRVADLSLHRLDADTFSFGVPAPAAPVALSRQTPVRATTGSSGPASTGGNAPQKALVSSPATTAAGPQPQITGQPLIVDSSNPNQGAVYAGASYTVPAAGAAYSYVYDGYNGTGLITHSAGTLTASGYILLGYNSGSTGTYNLSGTGVLNTFDLLRGQRRGRCLLAEWRLGQCQLRSLHRLKWRHPLHLHARRHGGAVGIPGRIHRDQRTGDVHTEWWDQHQFVWAYSRRRQYRHL